MSNMLGIEVQRQTLADINRILARIKESRHPVRRMLDIGCWDGSKTVTYAKTLGLDSENVYGIDCFENVVETARAKINAAVIDLEMDTLPFEDAFFDVVICNQVFEHLKQIYTPMTEIHRMLSPNGMLVFSVPNLASLHNRLLLLAGLQPTTIRVMGPHVRSFTREAAKGFLELNGLFQVVGQVGVGFYPLPMALARPLARLMPQLSHTVVFLARKAPGVSGPRWDDVMKMQSEQTNFF